eukprot:753492-Hanusia_phi.AAC.3
MNKPVPVAIGHSCDGGTNSANPPQVVYCSLGRSRCRAPAGPGEAEAISQMTTCLMISRGS